MVAACTLDSSGKAGGGDAGIGSSSGSSTGQTSSAPTSASNSATAASTLGTGSATSTTTAGSDPGTGAAASTSASESTGPAPSCAVDNGGCDTNASCDDTQGSVSCTCHVGWTGDGQTCSVDASLDTLRIELPCGTGSCGTYWCDAPDGAADSGMLMGDSEVVYDVTLRFRGVFEEKQYSGGMVDGLWNEGGTPANDSWDVYSLDIDDPQQSYYLNDGMANATYCTLVDYQHTVSIRGGATVQLAVSDTNSCATSNHDSNGDPIVVPGVPPSPDPFNGEFLQVDVVSIVPQG